MAGYESADVIATELLLAVHEASRLLEPEKFQQWTMRELRNHLDFDFAIWGAGDGRARNVHTASILDQTPDLFETWEPVKHVDQFANLVIGNTGRSWTLADIPKVKDTRAYNEHWRLYHATQMLSTMEVDQATGLHVFLTLCREHRTQGFSGQERTFKGLITRHLFLAARHNSHFELSRRGEAGQLAVIDRLGRVHCCGCLFGDLVSEEWGAAARRQLPLLPHTMNSCHYHGRWIRIEFMPLGDRFIARATAVGFMQQLTEREWEVASHYAHGASYKEVARSLGVSPATVRNHLQAIYSKLGIGDKGELASLFANDPLRGRRL